MPLPVPSEAIRGHIKVGFAGYATGRTGSFRPRFGCSHGAWDGCTGDLQAMSTPGICILPCRHPKPTSVEMVLAEAVVCDCLKRSKRCCRRRGWLEVVARVREAIRVPRLSSRQSAGGVWSCGWWQTPRLTGCGDDWIEAPLHDSSIAQIGGGGGAGVGYRQRSEQQWQQSAQVHYLAKAFRRAGCERWMGGEYAMAKAAGRVQTRSAAGR